MKKIFILISILWLALFLFSYKNYQFSADAIWKIEQQRREHVYLLPFIARLLHNKASYFIYAVFENFLSYCSPLIIFYLGVFYLLRDTSKIAKIVLFWMIVYPLFATLTLLPQTFLLLAPIIFPVSGILIYALCRKRSRL